ncbi:Crp/Fnr family transcriptional regulator [Umezawaea sp.]|uniref:Crp/Fnr family transcriptional regulator n=1 Tax=Umezawaea sp. TaxID=1955258 RepID=UPI002ED2F90D
MAELSSSPGDPLLTEEELLALRSVGRVIHRQEGHVFISQGEETDFALLILKGHVKIVVGKPPRIVAIRGPGEIVGEMAAIRQKPRSASIIALDEVEVLHLPATEWLKFLYDHPRAMHAQLYAADERLEQATRKIVESDLAVEQRLAKAIVELVDSGVGTPGEGGTLLRFSQQDLATLTGASLDSVKKIIRTFRDERLVDTGRQTLLIRGIGDLAQIADGNRTALL